MLSIVSVALTVARAIRALSIPEAAAIAGVSVDEVFYAENPLNDDPRCCETNCVGIGRGFDETHKNSLIDPCPLYSLTRSQFDDKSVCYGSANERESSYLPYNFLGQRHYAMWEPLYPSCKQNLQRSKANGELIYPNDDLSVLGTYTRYRSLYGKLSDT